MGTINEYSSFQFPQEYSDADLQEWKEKMRPSLMNLEYPYCKFTSSTVTAWNYVSLQYRMKIYYYK